MFLAGGPECEIGSGWFTGCKVEEASGIAEGAVTGDEIELRNMIYVQNNNEYCGAGFGMPGALEEFTFKFSKLTLKPEEGKSLDSLSVNGNGAMNTWVGVFSSSWWGRVGVAEEEGEEAEPRNWVIQEVP